MTAPAFASFFFLGFLGRSRTWPIEAFTWKSLPRYLLIVFALAGDSTMTRFLASCCLPDLMMPDEERAGQTADDVPQLQIGQTREQSARFKAAAGTQLLQGGGS